MTFLKRILLFSSLLALASTGYGQQLATKRTLTLEIAKKLVAAAEAEAAKNKFTMVICVVDDTGVPLLVQKMDDTQLASFEISIEKARTALMFKRPTKALEDAVAGGRNVVLRLPAMPVEGGIPLMADGKIIGAIGASGGTSPQDAQVAQAGVAALEAILKGGR